MNIDLHLHTTASDGRLQPIQLLHRAREVGLDVIAITDHDTVAGVRAAMQSALVTENELVLVNGVEISAQWSGVPVHIVGLNVDIDHRLFVDFIDSQQRLRAERNRQILHKLERLGVDGVHAQLESDLDVSGVLDLAQLGRPQIADALCALGVVKSRQQAFKKFLANGKSAYARIEWPSMDVAVEVIRQARGDAVLAHPLHYRLTGSKLNAMVRALLDCGGAGIEVVGSGQSDQQRQQLSRLAKKFGARGSIGSDFHTDSAPWQALGRLDDLPADCVPVWQDWGLQP